MSGDTFKATGLADILDGNVDESDAAIDAASAEAATPPLKPEGEQKPAGGDDTTGEAEAGKPAAGQGAPPAPKDGKTKTPEEGTTAALIAERKKRQDLERELEDLKKGKTAAPAAAAAPAPAPQPKVIPPRPDPYADPQGAEQWDRDRAAEREHVEEQRNFEDRCNASAELVIEMKGKEEYEKMEAGFGEAVRANPALAAQLRKHPNPALFAFREGKKFLEQKELSDPVAYKAKVEAELRATLEAEIRAKIAAEQGGGEDDDADDGATPPQKKVAAAIPQTLAKITSGAAPASRPAGQGAWSGPTPLSDIIKT